VLWPCRWWWGLVGLVADGDGDLVSPGLGLDSTYGDRFFFL